MFRASAAALVVALLSLSATATLRHVHADAGHHHEDHHHGPAVHAHAAQAHADHEPSPGFRLEACDPGSHAVTIMGACPSPDRGHVLVAMTADVRIRPDDGAVSSHLPAPEVRVHGPPGQLSCLLRAPPAIRLA